MLDLFFGDTPSGWTRHTNLATVKVGLFTSDPGEAGGGTEVSGNNYSRISITNNSTNFAAASSGVKVNSVDFFSAVASGTWGSMTHWVLFDNAGNPLYYGSLGGTVTVANGDQVVIRAGNLIISED